MLRIVNMFYNLDHCNKHAHHLLLYEIKDLLLLYISSRRWCISFSCALYWLFLRLQIALKNQNLTNKIQIHRRVITLNSHFWTTRNVWQFLDPNPRIFLICHVLDIISAIRQDSIKTPGYTAVSISLFCSWSFMDARRAADLCVCLTEGGAE